MAAFPRKIYGERIYEGKAKVIFRGPASTLFHYFKDSATAFNAQKKAEFLGKGSINLEISSLIFQHLARNGISSHFIAKVDDRAMETLALKMLPVEVVVRNILAGSLAKRLSEKEGRVLNPSIVEFYLKDDAKGDPLVSEDVLVALYEQNLDDLAQLKSMALKVNDVIAPLFKQAGLLLVDFKLEFGKTEKGEIVLADEVSPDTCRLWDAKTGEKLDKDRFRFDLGDLMAGYKIVLEKLKTVVKD